MLYIDGSYGEGGGQILRTSLSLAAITGQPIQIDQIRAGRSKPGLAIQHLTAVRSTAALCQAKLQGDFVGSTSLEFVPTCSPQAGHYHFDVNETAGTGSAGAITLILQTILMPLAFAGDASVVTLKGGTHVAWSPPMSYIQHVYLPMLQLMGLRATATLKTWGWYPRGGGEVELHVSHHDRLNGLQISDRGSLQQVTGQAVVTELPSHIPQRMASRAENLLRQAQLKTQIQPLREKGVAPGAGIFLTALYKHSRAGFSAIGKVGLAAERVAELAVEALLDFHDNGAPIDSFLADQLLLPMALADQPSQYRATEITPHLTTNACVIEQFGVANVAIDLSTNTVTVTPTR